MKDYVSVPNILNTFPTVAAKNSSGAGATDGTGLVADWLNSDWGFKQMLLSRAGLTPSGSVEVYTAANAFNHTTPGQVTITLATAQVIQALQFQFGSPGELVLWCRSQAPATVGARVLLLQGQTIAVASYPDLCNAVYCGDAANNTTGVPFYLSSDSGGVTRATTGAYLTLPDARGRTIRGVDIGNLKDPLGSTRGGGTPNGSDEADAMQGHFHQIGFYHYGSFSGTGNYGLVENSGTSAVVQVPTASPITDGTNGTPRTSAETRMINLACYIGIRY